jgi:very-short-patch-repair endonuclease
MTTLKADIEEGEITISDDGKKIKYIMIEGEPWFKGKEFTKLLGYKDPDVGVRSHVCFPNKRTYADLTGNNRVPYNVRTAYYINREGCKSILLKTEMPSASSVAKHFNISVDTKYLRKEIEIVSFIQEYLTRLKIPFEFQKTVGPYRVDLFIPTQHIAVEIDEYGHKDRNVQYETSRENFIQHKLQCRFLRVNPDASDFKLATLLADLTILLFELR